MSNNPIVSVFIPYYNDKEFLKHSIESVLNQTYQNWELILLNHATQDSCRQIAHSYNDVRIKHIDMPYNLGYGGSGFLLKESLKIAKGKYIKLFCADDIMVTDGLEKLVNYMEENSNVDFAFGNVEYIDFKGKDLKKNWFESREGFNINIKEVELIKKYSEFIGLLPYIGCIIKKEILFNITINTTFIYMFDWSLWLELLCAKYKIGFCNEIVAKYRFHTGQVSSPSQHLNVFYLTTFERAYFWHIFQKIQDIETAKKVFCDSKYVDMLKEKEDIPFFVAQALLKNNQYCIYAYSYVSKLLNNEQTREYLQKTFNYGIKDLRKDCMDNFTVRKVAIENRRKVYMKNVGELNFKDLIFLFFYKIYLFFTFTLTEKRKNKSL
ncbi:MAG: glycosyltransferase family 2 protein [Elusimicrobia bacterium]|nr:glycosyltransferase family 2 protein [Elusimicrobiota bacterium]